MTVPGSSFMTHRLGYVTKDMYEVPHVSFTVWLQPLFEPNLKPMGKLCSPKSSIDHGLRPWLVDVLRPQLAMDCSLDCRLTTSVIGKELIIIFFRNIIS